MAIMIPSNISAYVNSNAEKKIFGWFQNAPGTENWYVLHSLGVANHNTVIRGETDFLVLAPRLGCFALEVKGGEVKQLPDGRWRFTGRDGRTGYKNRSPFAQANDGIHSIISYIMQHLDSQHQHLKYVLFGSGVMFPDITFSYSGIEADQEQIFDYRDSQKVRGFIERLSGYAQRKWTEKYHFSAVSKLPDSDDIKYIVSLLRGEFDCPVPINMEIDEVKQTQFQLTQQQYNCLDGLEDNARCLITGYAGTGKTMVAVEAARRFAETGERVALFCFNANLSDWLRSKCAEKEIPLAYVGSLHSYMMSLTGLRPASSDDSGTFYNERLPYAAYEHLNNRSEEAFDRIIIDEVQDLLAAPYLRVFDSLLKKGLGRGKWVMLGDLTHQAIYTSASSDDMIGQLEEFAPFFARYNLKQNCRNTKQICQGITMVTGIRFDQRGRKLTEGRTIDWQTWKNDDEQYEKLVRILTELRDNHVDPGQITILSPVRRDKSVVQMLNGIKVRNYSVNSPHELTFSTVQGFKGLEKPVIILTDIKDLRDEKLLYVAISRARSRLYILVDEGAYSRELINMYGRLNENVR